MLYMVYTMVYIKKTGIYHDIYHPNWYIPLYISKNIQWYILLVGNLDLLLPHGVYHGIYQFFGIYHGIYRSQGVIYHGIYKFDLFLPHGIYQLGWYIAWYASFFLWYIAWHEMGCNRAKVGCTYGIYLKVAYTMWGIYHANYDIFHAINLVLR